MKRSILILTIIWILCVSCSRNIYKETPVVVQASSKEAIVNTRIDTLIIRDSIDRWLKNDTVYITRVKNIYKYRILSDTILRIDTVPKIVVKTETKEIITNQLNGIQKVLLWLGIFFILYVLFKLLKK